MVNAREAALAKALRDVAALLTYKQGGIENADISDLQEDVETARETAQAALRVKSKPSRRRVVIDVRGGVADIAWQDRGIKVTIRDWDSCSECGGVDCNHGRDALTVHGEPN